MRNKATGEPFEKVSTEYDWTVNYGLPVLQIKSVISQLPQNGCFYN